MISFSPACASILPRMSVLLLLALAVPAAAQDAEPPKAFTVRLATGGGDALIDAWKAGELAHLELGGGLPAIEPPAADPADLNNDEEN